MAKFILFLVLAATAATVLAKPDLGEDVFQPEVLVLPEPVQEELEPRNCNALFCDHNCIMRGFPHGGFCQGGVCICRNPRSNDEEIYENAVPVLPEPVQVELEPRNCNALFCDHNCIMRGFPHGGFCQSGVCICRNPRINDEEIYQQAVPVLPEPEQVEVEPRNCNALFCDHNCIMRGFPHGGFCQGGVCICRNPRIDDEEIYQQALPVLPEPVQVEVEPRNCNALFCDHNCITVCISIGFPHGGFCQGDVCICRNPRINDEEIYQNAVPVLPEPVQIEPEARNCATMSCNTQCIFRGFPDGGFCQSGVCICRNPRVYDD